MGYKTYPEQLLQHIDFLRSKSLNVDEIEVDSGFIGCRLTDKENGRGEYSYKTFTKQLENGYLGINTWCRGEGGEISTFSTYGLPPSESDLAVKLESRLIPKSMTEYEEASKKAYGFWINSDKSGVSDYLDRKGVGYHGIRFRNNQYGNIAVIPMQDVEGRIWNYQILNADGSKRDCKDARVDGLFHPLSSLKDQPLIGVAESYVTAATCMENTGITCVCCFGCNNIKSVVFSLLKNILTVRLSYLLTMIDIWIKIKAI